MRYSYIQKLTKLVVYLPINKRSKFHPYETPKLIFSGVRGPETNPHVRGDEKMHFGKAHINPTTMESPQSKNAPTNCLSTTSCEAIKQRGAAEDRTGQGGHYLHGRCSK